MFDEIERKKHIKYIINTFCNLLYKINSNNKINGFILIFFHWLITFIMIIYLIIGNVNKLYYIVCFLLFIVIILYLYFKGCILVFIERYLLNTKHWWGPWMLLFYPLEYIYNIKITSKIATMIINYSIIPLVIIIVIKILNYN